jgi:hypothetical protein
MGNPNPSPETRFRPGEITNFKAGGVAQAIKDVVDGKPLRGNIAVIQGRFDEQFTTHTGRVDAQRWLAAAFFAVTQGLLAVIQAALDNDEQDKAVAYIRHLGTLGSKAGTELSRLDELARAIDARTLDYDKLIEELQQ